ncbi:MAG TPA: hypothetical protein GXX36_16685 [Clostridiaceae bacterium]|nr:hypothetical protein [Clostridiaceae bacterium]
MGLLPGGVVTAKGTAEIALSEEGEFIRRPEQDIIKIAVVERHKGTGNIALALLRGYGIKSGAVALSIAHDSHNITHKDAYEQLGINKEVEPYLLSSL